MICILETQQFLEELDKLPDVISESSSMDHIKDVRLNIPEIMKVRQATGTGFVICKKLYQKTGDADKAVELYYTTSIKLSKK